MSEEQKKAVRPENNLVGKVLNNNYRIDRLIGAGGMGEVYEGEHLFTGNRVAIKAVLQSLSHDEKVLSLFKREARILFKLTDEAIARYLDSFHEPVVDRYCLVMDFIDGVPLSDRIKLGEVLTEAEARRLMRRVAVALDRAHKLEIVHRDLSPDNIMLRGGNVDQAVLIDFGIARSATMTEGTLHGQFAGKFKYVSPEQLGHFGGEVGPRTDIYGLALLIAAALRGKPLDMGSSIVEAVNARRAIPALDGVPPGLAPLLAHMLEPDPVNRPADMGAVVRLLDEPRLIPGVYGQWGGAMDGGDDRTVIATPMQMTGAGSSLPPGTLQTAGLQTGGMQTGASQMPGTATSYPPPGSMTPASMAPASMAPGQMVTGATTGGGTFTGLPKTEPVPEAPPARKKGGGLAIVLGLLVLAGAGGAGWLYMQGKLPIPGLPKPPQITEETTPAPEPQPVETTEATPPESVTPPAVDPDPAPERPQQANAPALGPPNAATREGFLAAYRVEEPCSFATRITSGGNSGKIAVFADALGKLPAISQAYAGTFGAAPTVLEQQVTTAQCPVLELMRGLQGRKADAPLVTLDADVVPSGGSVIGRIANLQGRTLWLFLVSGTGAVFDLTDRIERQPDGSALLAIGLKSDSDKPEPQLIVALASPRALVTAGTAAPGVPAASLIPAVAAEITTRKLEVGAQAAFLTLTP
ncbi:serine/threonine-protein kinase [Rhodobacter sp. JA431]|uniref:protein kinase domain-containing protein n=1 Tax=Rhodobacter sp. JA431 TaxID=570013 RepID=UPI000BD85363|nr:protein kinase [Rhodobacter sp. JA431]SOC10589.1 serine/threonine-protein kinase [Rhodobacter sp. JA431]